MKIRSISLLLLVGIMMVSGFACGTTEWQLTTIVEGQGEISPDEGTFSDGSGLTITAIPESGWKFDHWGGQASGSTNPITITMDIDKTIYAYFVETIPTPTPIQGIKLTVGNIPQGWYLEEESANIERGRVWYIDNEDGDFVQIYYEDVPRMLLGHETDPDYLIARAIAESATFEPDETGNMIASGQIAGYTEKYDPYWDWYEMEIVFVLDSVYIDIYTIYDATTWDEAQAMAIINSISIK